MQSRTFFIGCLVLALIVLSPPPPAVRAAEGMPAGFVSLSDVLPTVPLEIRYHGSHNFLGRPVEGYRAPRCILTRPAAAALAKVQADLIPFSLSLKIYDGYRPQRAVDDFVRWAKDLDDRRMQAEFYPNVNKAHLFRDGYIDSRSGHSRGSTVDLTIVPLPLPPQPAYRPGQPLVACYRPAGERFADNGIDMGTGFDCFDERSHPANSGIGLPQRINRLLLKTLMEKHGFRHYDKEWWHFTLNNEPYPDTYFDFPVQ